MSFFQTLGAILGLAVSAGGAEFFPAGDLNSQKEEIPLTTPEQALQSISLPPGFEARLFAGEPDVQQPIAMAWDDRGRLWVAENYTYAESKVGFDPRFKDRILIFEDTDGDGRFNKRTVFWEGSKITGIELGFGGVWVLCAPKMVFIPDRNHDDKPDGEPETVLDGWNAVEVRHNIVNGLRWGPDGWLYGRHGILATSKVGRPGAPESERVSINCGIWRYHPTRKIFEAVAHGTTNPWGLDFDEYGEAFFINTVIGHLWHLIPGAHYRRMYGEDFNPNLYALIDQHADHYHWDTGRDWTDSRNGTENHARLGGGHAHSGLMIYLGDNWPAKYRNEIFTVNLHGRRLNRDHPERAGSGYVGKHREDFMFTKDPWFRAVELTYGPDGTVYLCDWSDIGECHENDGVHRISGRIFNIRYGNGVAKPVVPMSLRPDAELVQLQFHPNDWFVRQARLELQDRAARNIDLAAAKNELLKQFVRQAEIPKKLRAMWALRAIGGADDSWLLEQTRHKDEHIRTWAVRFLSENAESASKASERFIRMAGSDSSGLVRLALASALQRVGDAARVGIAHSLAQHRDDSGDHNQPLMLWYGIEPLAATHARELAEIASQTPLRTLREFAARRLAMDPSNRGAAETLLAASVRARESDFLLDVLTGFNEAWKGLRKMNAPAGWDAAWKKAQGSSNKTIHEIARRLGVAFDDKRALDETRRLASNPGEEPLARRAALDVLVVHQDPETMSKLATHFAEPVLALPAARGLVEANHPEAPRLLVDHFGSVPHSDRGEWLSLMASRRPMARALLQAVAGGKIPRSEIPAFIARQITTLKDPELTRLLAGTWGEVRDTDAEKTAQIASWKQKLPPEVLSKANPKAGHEVFKKTCAVCHTLFGEGGKVGPDLTGAGRDNLDYLLQNIIDPSAVVASDFRVSIIETRDGRVLNGVMGRSSGATVGIQTPNGWVIVERDQIEKIEQSRLSLMPEGLLDGLGENEVRDLIAFLMKK